MANDTRCDESKVGMRILVHGHLGMGNLGDELMLAPILASLAERFPSARLVVSAGEHLPSTLAADPQVEIVPRTLLQLFKEIFRCQVFLIAGGTHLASFRGAGRHLKGILRQLLLVMWARLTLSRVMMLSVGFGPFEEPRGERLAKFLLRLTHYISVRDATSAQWLSTLNRPADSYDQCHDAALFTPRKPEQRDEPFLGISLMPYFANYGGEVEKDVAIVEQFVPIIECWKIVHPHAKICLYSFLKQDSIYADNRVLGLLKQRFADDDCIQMLDETPDIELTQEVFAKFTHFISMRYHSQVMAWLNEVPQMCITYHRKNRLFAVEYGIPEQACLDVEELIRGELGERVEDFFRKPQQYSASKTPVNILSECGGLIPSEPTDLF